MPSSDDVAEWLRVTGAGESAQAERAAQAEQVATEVTVWRTSFSRGYGRKQRDIEEIERESHVIYSFAPSIIPGPLQTAEYARRASGPGIPRSATLRSLTMSMRGFSASSSSTTRPGGGCSSSPRGRCDGSLALPK
jgi:Domain of unknown function (DUF5753)